MNTIEKWKFDYVIWRIRRFLLRYDRFVNERTDEANKRCNDAIEQLRILVNEVDNDLF